MNAALILAAGESRRMGSPKALLCYRNQTFLDRLTGLFAVYCSPVIVVLGAGAEAIRKAAASGATFVVNSEWQRGQTSSLQCGLAAVPRETEGVLLTLVDHPAVRADTVEALLGKAGSLSDGASEPRPSGSVRIRIPRYGGKRGHPIWFSRELIPEFLAIREPRTAKDVVHTHAAATEFLDLDDPGIVTDIDDPAAYRALTGASL